MGDLARMLLLLLACLEDMLYDLDGFTKLVEARTQLEWKEETLTKPKLRNYVGIRDFAQWQCCP